MENRDIFEEVEATIETVFRKYKKYEVLSLKEDLKKVSEGTLLVYTGPKKYDSERLVGI